MVDLHDGPVRGTATSEAIFAFHHINAYQDGDQIVLDTTKQRSFLLVPDAATFTANRSTATT